MAKDSFSIRTKAGTLETFLMTSRMDTVCFNMGINTTLVTSKTV